MAGLHVTDGQRLGMTAVPNVFIDNFLPEASGEFVKVYLMLLRQVSKGEDVSVARLAEGLYNTEKTVLMALRYWERAGVLELEYGMNGELEGIIIAGGDAMKAASSFADEAKDSESSDIGKKDGFMPAYDRSDRGDILEGLQDDEDFRQLLYLAEMYTGSTLTEADCSVIGNLYGTLRMPADLLEYLIEECVMQGKKNISYIEKVGLDWHSRGIMTVGQAKEEKEKNTVYRVLKAFGLGRRDPTSKETEMIDKWTRDYGMSPDIIVEACDRTMESIHEPSFNYTDSILKRWKDEGVREKADIIRLDEKRKSEKDNKTLKKSQDTKRPNKFHNFPQRDYDYDKIVKELNGF